VLSKKRTYNFLVQGTTQYLYNDTLKLPKIQKKESKIESRIGPRFLKSLDPDVDAPVE
jgi:hypothetical protein